MCVNKKINSRKSISTAQDCPKHHKTQEKHIITIKNKNKDKKYKKNRKQSKNRPFYNKQSPFRSESQQQKIKRLNQHID